MTSSPPSKKVIAIIGATGNQGGGLLRAILNEGPNSQFVARAITRDANSEKAKALQAKGVEVVQADTANEAALAEAIKGCYGFYCVTVDDFVTPENEKKQAETMAKAAKKAGIKHVIWSTLEDSRAFISRENSNIPTINGKYKIPPFDLKAESDQFFADLPTTYLLTVTYWDCFFDDMKKSPEDGKYFLSYPMGTNKTMLGISLDDIGKCALAIFKRSQEYVNKRVGIYSEGLTMEEMVAKLSKSTGKDVCYDPISCEVFRKFGFPGAEDLANMFQYWQDYPKEFASLRSVEETRKLNPDLMTFDQWLAKNKGTISFD